MKKAFLILPALTLFLAACLTLFPSASQADSLTLTTYYPAPFGAYKTLKLSPTAGVPSACNAANEGLLYYESGTDLVMVCMTSGWEVLGGRWTLNGTDLSPNNTAWNIGIGLTNPASRLSVSGGVSVGANYATQAAAADGMIVEGSMGIGTTSAVSQLNVGGGVTVGGTYTTNGNAAPANGLIVEGIVGVGTTGAGSQLNVGGGVTVGATYTTNGNAAPANGLIVEGNVGVGRNTVTAGYELDVGGDIKASGDIYTATGTIEGAVVKGAVYQ